MSLKYKHSSKTLADWASLNPIIVNNEIVIEKDTNKLKIGNGTDHYLDLLYACSDNLSGTNYIMVYGVGTPTENAAELQAAYDAAKNMPRYLGEFAFTDSISIYKGQTLKVIGPNVYIKALTDTSIPIGNLFGDSNLRTIIPTEVEAKSVRTTVIVAPGDYTFDATKFEVDATGINIVSLTGNADVKLDGTNVTADYVYIKGIDNGINRFMVASNLDNSVFENCVGGDYSFGNDDELSIVISSTFIKCKGGRGAFGVGEAAQLTGTFIDCVGGYYAFLGNGYEGILSGTFVNCIGGDNSFGSDDASSIPGNFTNCIGGAYSFGGWVDAPVGINGVLLNCRLTSGIFAPVIGDGKMCNCIDGNGDIVNSYATYANEVAAVAAGLSSGTTYKTVTGELRVKL